MQLQLFSAALILAVALLTSAVFSQVPGEWLPSSSDLPFVVALESKGLRTCVGVILTERSVLTNGDCAFNFAGNKEPLNRTSLRILDGAWQLEYMEYTNHKNGFLICTNVPGPNDNCLGTKSPMLLKKIDDSTWAVAGMAATGNCYTVNETDFNSVWSQPWFLGKVIAEATGNLSFDNGLDIDSQKASSINGVKIGVPVGMALVFVLVGVFLWVRYKRRQRARAIPQQVELATMSEEPKPTHHQHSVHFAQYQPWPQPVSALHASQVVDEPPPPYSSHFRSN
ncbi:hypothetical protein GQ42DRAFT_165797 [Ramicandelaber brevisporus]|nr:hypothetical protein GQ42DRAFT_165797 [Ramicandelaber brevisporus]